MPYIKTTYDNEDELIMSILTLYNNGDMVQLDPTFSKGRLYKNLFASPSLRFDLNPQTEDTIKSDCTSLPLEDSTIDSMLFDPPFVIGQGKSTNGIMRGRFSAFYKLDDLRKMYTASLIEFRRILQKDGLLLFKCQDTVTSGKQFFTHMFIILTAESLGYLVEDLFVLVRNKAIIDPKWKGQKHARKTHSYYIVLRKKGI